MGYLFTSESVSEGHPDKVADQISDAILDKIIAYDPDAKVACETLVTTGQTVIAGEIKTNTYVEVSICSTEIVVGFSVLFMSNRRILTGGLYGKIRWNREPEIKV